MKKLSDTIERKFVETIDVDEWEVLTDTGYHSISASNMTVKYEIYEVVFDNGTTIKCADNHIFMAIDGSEVFAKDSLGKTFKTIDGESTVLSVAQTGIYEHMYDLSVDSEDHTYYTDGVLSHNTQNNAAYILWYSLFNERKTSAILANKYDTVKEIIGRFQFMYEMLPQFLKVGVVEYNKSSITFENGSRVFGAATSSSGIRGKSVNLLLIDEAAIIPSNIADEFFASIYPTISSGETTKVIMCSTPLGFNHWYKLWEDAKNERNKFIPVFIPWWEIPGRDKEWAAEQLAQLGETRYRAEVECEFLGSTRTLLTTSSLQSLTSQPVIKEAAGVSIIEEPVEGDTYAITVDVAKGVNADYSAFSVFNISRTPYKQVATFRDNTILPVLYPPAIIGAARYYNNAYVLVETNVSDNVAKSVLIDNEYENTLWVDKGRLRLGYGSSQSSFGINTDRKTKSNGVKQLKTLIDTQKLLVQDYRTIEELGSFIEKSLGIYAAQDGKHDDMVMTLVLFAWLTTCDEFYDLVEGGINKQALFEHEIGEVKEEFVPLGILSHDYAPDHLKNVVEVSDGVVWESASDSSFDDGSFTDWYQTQQ